MREFRKKNKKGKNMIDLNNTKQIVSLISRLQLLCEGFDEVNKSAVITSKVKILLEVSKQKDTSPNILKSKVGLAKSNLAILCNELVKEGMLTKTRDTIDNRAICYNITQSGQEWLDGVMAKIKKNFESELAYKNNMKQIENAVSELFELVK